jgi:hypothetical protein
MALPLFAQETSQPAAKPAAATTAEPLAVLKTSHPMFGQGLADGLGITDPLPDLGSDGHYAFTMNAERRFAVALGKGDVPVLEVQARPGALMDAFAEPIEGGRAAVQTALSVVLQQMGLTGKEAVLWTRAVWDFPRQVAVVTLQVTGDIEDPRVGGLDVALDLVPLPDAPFARFLGALAPCPAGVPALPGKSLLGVQVSLAPASLRSLVEPLLEASAAMTFPTAELRQRAPKLQLEALGHYDGGIALGLAAEPLAGRILAGLLDGPAYGKFLASEPYRSLMGQRKLANRNQELQVAFGAEQHRGVAFDRTVVKSEDEDEPLLAGLAASLTGAAGKYLVGAMGGGGNLTKNAATLADAALDDRVKRAPLAEGVLLRLAVDLPGFLPMLAQFGTELPPEAADEMPGEVVLTLGKHKGALRLALHIQ